MILLVGLGNPGDKYDNTRHNAGFLTVDKIVEQQGGDWRTETKNDAMVAKIKIGLTDVIAAKPLTYMNLSGNAVSKLAHYYKVEPEEIIVVSDDINLEWGTVRLRRGGSDGGHNGLKSIIGTVGEEFFRIRIGVGYNDQIPAEDFVLKRLNDGEKQLLVTSVDKTADYLINSNLSELSEQTI